MRSTDVEPEVLVQRVELLARNLELQFVVAQRKCARAALLELELGQRVRVPHVRAFRDLCRWVVVDDGPHMRNGIGWGD